MQLLEKRPSDTPREVCRAVILIVRRSALVKVDSPRAIDQCIDFFGESKDAASATWHLACLCRGMRHASLTLRIEEGESNMRTLRLALSLLAIVMLAGACATAGSPGVQSAGSLTQSDASRTPTLRMGTDPSGARGPWCPPNLFGPYSGVYCGPGIPPARLH